MSKRVAIIITCNGCLKSNCTLIVQTEMVGRFQLDLCRECDEKGRYICTSCITVHNHEKDCLEPAVAKLEARGFQPV